MITPTNEKMRCQPIPNCRERRPRKIAFCVPQRFSVNISERRREYVCRSTKSKSIRLPPRYLGFRSLIWYHTHVEWTNVFFNLFVVSFAVVYYSFKSFNRKQIARSWQDDTSELKQPQQSRREERYKFAYLTMKNGTLARFARTVFLLVHFAGVLVLSIPVVKHDDLLCSCVDNGVTTWPQIGDFLLSSLSHSSQINSRIVSKLFESQTTWNNRGMVNEAWTYIFWWPSCYRL